MNDGYRPYSDDGLPAAEEVTGTTYQDYSPHPKQPGWVAMLLSAIKLTFKEYSIVPVGRLRIDGNTRLFSYGLIPLIGFVLGLVWMGWVNIAISLRTSAFLTITLGLLFHYVIQAGLPLQYFGASCDAFFSRQRQDIQVRMLQDKRLRVPGLFSALMLALAEQIAFYYILIRSGIWRSLVAMLCVFVFARGLSSLFTLSLPPLIPEEDGDMKTLRTVQLILLIVLAVSAVGLILSGVWAAFVSLVVMAIAAYLSYLFIKNRFKGIMREMSGFMMSLSEVFGLLALTLPLGTFLW